MSLLTLLLMLVLVVLLGMLAMPSARREIVFRARAAGGAARAKAGITSHRPLLKTALAGVRAKTLYGLSSAVVPDDVRVLVAPEDMASIGPLREEYEQDLADAIVRMVADQRPARGELRLRLLGDPSVLIEEDAEVRPGMPVVHAYVRKGTVRETVNPDSYSTVRQDGSTEAMAAVTVLWEGREAWHHLRPGEHHVGRSPKADIIIRDAGVSRVHARLEVSSEGELRVEDLNSANGLRVNGELISQATRLEPGQIVRLAKDVELRVDMASSP